MKKIIPNIEFTKRLQNSEGISLSKLEESYSGYNTSAPHRHKYYELLFFNESGGLHEIDFTPYKISGSSVHFVSPEQVHLLRRDPHVTGSVLSFTEDFMLDPGSENVFSDQFAFLSSHSQNPVLSITDEDHIQEIRYALNMIEKELHSSGEDKRDALLSWLKLILIRMKRLISSESANSFVEHNKSEITLKFKNLLSKNFLNIRTVQEYASLLNISAGHLSETVQKDTGKTAGEFLHERLVLEAKRLLYHSKKSIKEIASELNFEDPSYFARFFKTHTGSTPDQFRKSIREKYL